MNKAPPPKPPSHNWTAEKLALQDRKTVEMIMERATAAGAIDLVEMCNQDIASRSQTKVKRIKATSSSHSSTDVVSGFHFVCAKDRGVTDLGDGKFRSGSWVVAEAHARKAVSAGSYLALHESRSEMSYRQGIILDYRRVPRDMVGNDENGGEPKTKEGIEFLIQETFNPYAWVGDATGEKGYLWNNSLGDAVSVGDAS